MAHEQTPPHCTIPSLETHNCASNHIRFQIVGNSVYIQTWDEIQYYCKRMIPAKSLLDGATTQDRRFDHAQMKIMWWHKILLKHSTHLHFLDKSEGFFKCQLLWFRGQGTKDHHHSWICPQHLICSWHCTSLASEVWAAKEEEITIIKGILPHLSQKISSLN